MMRSVVVAGLVWALTGCAGGLASIPLPAPGHVDTDITLTAVFTNALNLPVKAKVKLNGADIGEVESIHAQDFSARVTMKVSAGAPLFTDTVAELRSATPLGDIFIAVRRGPDATSDAARLGDGDTITVDHTTSAATIEDVLGSAALLVNGGAIRSLVSTVNGAGTAVGGRGAKVAALLHDSNTLLSRLNARSAQIDGALRNTSDLAATLTARRDTLNTVLAAATPATATLADNTTNLADMIAAAGRITGQLNRFPSMQGTDARSTISDLNRLSDVFNQIATDPELNMNIWNRMITGITHITSGPDIHAVGIVTQLAIGALPDKNYPGDPGIHGPDGTDWHAMIGSLRYEWNLLLSRIYGPEHQPR
ncbi:MCE family protein [Mycolicibacter kumamotonensis]|jgi:virulence factor Mce-like protein|uniref:Mammalian cell entry protein n=1 Tax=Mycolicibacter kumamotonensis TaxID=354243 RepID=A0A1B8S9X3_9MYCO|nr:MCE family protein [Mycolicibacter kumamotonensis]OBY29510.1 mammalian cell entry protein [Mycolicibacter kumamotonensis]